MLVLGGLDQAGNRICKEFQHHDFHAPMIVADLHRPRPRGSGPRYCDSGAHRYVAFEVQVCARLSPVLRVALLRSELPCLRGGGRIECGPPPINTKQRILSNTK